jgi:hypothetical protein
VVFQPSPGEFAAEERLLNEPIYKKARDKIVEFIKQLQAARKPEDYVALHRSVLAHFIAYQETADDAIALRMEVRSRIRELARREPKPIDDIQEQQALLDRVANQEATLKAVHHLIRAVGDGIAWRALRYDRRAFTVLGEGERVGRVASGIGRDAELTALANLWENEGQFAIHNDMTNCLRHGDLTAIREAGGEAEVTIYEVKAGTSHDVAQLRRLERATELLRTNLDPTGGSDGGILRVTPVPARYETFLSALPGLVERAKEVGFDWILPHPCLMVGAVDYRVWGRGDVDDFTERFAKMRAEIGWPGKEPEILDWMSSARRMRDRRHSFSSLAPFAIFSLAPEDIADVISGPIDLFFSLHLRRLEEALSRDGVSVRVARPPESSTLFLEASRDGRGVTVPPHLREQMMTELVTPGCIFAAVDEILKLNAANPSEAYDSRIVVFADERHVWEADDAASSEATASIRS